MSLRGFHIVFITLTTLLCVFMTVWGFALAPADAGSMAPVMGFLGVLGTIGLPVYGVYFYRKAKKLVL
ncbi:MAG: hypothetical protein HKN82_13745 [Akkermansiaceae bacterium]|nr:hypothetical protein [Akkermansiaceae bacterium]NNM28787.1 hypothetical protein [Akkermansiaceae bacterium]